MVKFIAKTLATARDVPELINKYQALKKDPLPPS